MSRLEKILEEKGVFADDRDEDEGDVQQEGDAQDQSEDPDRQPEEDAGTIPDPDVDDSRPEYDEEDEEPEEESEEEPAQGDEESPEGDGKRAPRGGDALDDETLVPVADEQGKEVEVPLKDLKQSYRTAQETSRWQRAAQAKEDGVKRVIQELLRDPLSAARQLYSSRMSEGEAYDRVVKLATDFLSRHIEETENPTLRERRRLEEDRQRFETEKEQREREVREGQIQALEEQYHKEATDAITASGFPSLEDDPDTWRDVYSEVMDLRATAMRVGQDLTAEQAASKVKARREREVSRLLQTIPPEELYERYPEQAKKLAKLEAKNLKQSQQGKSRPKRTASRDLPKREDRRVYTSVRDKFEDLRKHI